MHGACRCERLGPAGLFSHELQLGSLSADLLPKTGLVAAVGKPLRVLEFGTEQVTESRGGMGRRRWEGRGQGDELCVCVWRGVCVCEHVHICTAQVWPSPMAKPLVLWKARTDF